jgi:hypothetical protein
MQKNIIVILVYFSYLYWLNTDGVCCSDSDTVVAYQYCLIHAKHRLNPCFLWSVFRSSIDKRTCFFTPFLLTALFLLLSSLSINSVTVCLNRDSLYSCYRTMNISICCMCLLHLLCQSLNNLFYFSFAILSLCKEILNSELVL